MNREDYLKLRNLPENINLTDEDFYKKYKEMFDESYIYREGKIIRKIKDFKQNMQDIKGRVEKRTVIL